MANACPKRRAEEANMHPESLFIFLLVGAIAGWLGGIVVKGYGLGLVGDILVGVIGAFIGGWLFGHFHLVEGAGFVGDVIGATVGAIILLLALRLVRRPRFSLRPRFFSLRPRFSLRRWL
jgi:uncharacterized membrane protein YeaQ/YmgE (transglycosylase-associated protein family)